MRFASYRRLPAVSTYEEAKKLLDTTTPIRGSSKPKRYPLGERRDSFKFTLRCIGDADSLPTANWYKQAPGSQDGDIELLLYNTPVVVFHKPTPEESMDGSAQVSITQGYAYWSTADCSFISEVLFHYILDANRSKGMLVLKMRDGSRQVLQRKESGRFTLNPQAGTMTKLQSNTDTPTLMTHKLNRKATNIVRARYGAFYRYVKGMIGVRKELKPSYMVDSRGEREAPYYIVRSSADEVRSALGDEAIMSVEIAMGKMPTIYSHRSPHSPNSPVFCVEAKDFPQLMYKPGKKALREYWNNDTGRNETKEVSTRYADWLAQVKDFIALITPITSDPSNPTPTPEDEDKQISNFSRAFTLLMLQQRSVHNYGWGVVSIYPEQEFNAVQIPKMLDEIIFKFHSDEVFERVPVAANKVPSHNYEKWVTREYEF